LSSHGKETFSYRVSKCRATLVAVSHPSIVEESQKTNKDVEALEKIVYSPPMPPSDVDQAIGWSRPSLSPEDDTPSDVSKLSNTIAQQEQPPTTTTTTTKPTKPNKPKANNIVIKSTRSHRQSIKKRSTSSKIQSAKEDISTAPSPPPANSISAASLRAQQRSTTHHSHKSQQKEGTKDADKDGDAEILNPEIAKELEADAAFLKGLWSSLRSKQRGSGTSSSSGVEVSAISRFLSKSSDALLNKEQELRLGTMLQRGAAAQKVIDTLKENNNNNIHFDENEGLKQHQQGQQQQQQQQQQLLEATGAPSMKVLQSWLSSGQEARSLLYEYNIRLALKVAHRYSRSQTTSSTAASALVVDLFPEALVGLGKAVGRYDASKGFRFSTYAHWWILQSVSRAVNDQNRVIRIPQNVLEILSKMNRASSNIMKADPGRTTPPTVAEVAKKIGVSEQKLLNVIRFTKEPISIDQTGEAGSKDSGGMMPTRVAGRYSPGSGGSLSTSGGGGDGGGGSSSIITAIIGGGGGNSVTASLAASSSGGTGGGMYADIDDLAAAAEEAEDHWFSPENEEHLKFCLTVVLSTLPTTRHENIVRMRYGLPPPSVSSSSSSSSSSFSSSNRLDAGGKGRVKSSRNITDNDTRFLYRNSGDRIQLEELGETFNRSKERIRQIENEAMNLLRTQERREMLKILMSKAKEDWPDDLKKKVERIFN